MLRCLLYYVFLFAVIITGSMLFGDCITVVRVSLIVAALCLFGCLLSFMISFMFCSVSALIDVGCVRLCCMFAFIVGVSAWF